MNLLSCFRSVPGVCWHRFRKCHAGSARENRPNTYRQRGPGSGENTPAKTQVRIRYDHGRQTVETGHTAGPERKSAHRRPGAGKLAQRTGNE